jgi:hypothetical protein
MRDQRGQATFHFPPVATRQVRQILAQVAVIQIAQAALLNQLRHRLQPSRFVGQIQVC